ncbi:MAG: YlxR family protein [Propionicimonas sp.]|uniref:YlxR family protein n=1 Tax=Propionicimonas sp. TaxID=1955623 RepID=UPI003D0B2FF8
MTPERTCVGCRSTEPKAGLVRLVWDEASAAVVLDHRQALPGRGCYLHPACGPVALKRRAIGRALRRTVDGDQVAVLLAELRPA